MRLLRDLVVEFVFAAALTGLVLGHLVLGLVLLVIGSVLLGMIHRGRGPLSLTSSGPSTTSPTGL